MMIKLRLIFRKFPSDFLLFHVGETHPKKNDDYGLHRISIIILLIIFRCNQYQFIDNFAAMT